MKAKETGLFPFLNGTKQFVIPIYQRTYSWTQEQCQQLWDDILRIAKDTNIPGHFIGSVVYVEGDMYGSAVVPQLLVIDGQQRLTTLSLLIAALGKVIEERTNEQVEISPDRLRNYYLLNNYEEGELRYKLLLTQGDKTTLMKVIDDHLLDDSVAPRIRENYDFFLNQVRKTTSLQAIFSGLQRLIIVDISLERDKDNPQLIFESLNSTGLKLTQADLIRNYILMGQQHNIQTQLYNDHWYPMEQRFGHAGYADRFDRFMRDYLTIKLGRIPNIDSVYEEFKRYVQQNQLSLHDVVADIGQHSGYYVQLSFARSDDQILAQAIRNLHTLRVDVAYPFLMECLRTYEEHLLTRKDLLIILRLVESYVFRRAICGIPTNSLNKTFANLKRDMDDDRLLERFGLSASAGMVERLEAALLDKDSYRRFPNDEEFRRELLAKDVNNFRNRNYLLYRLEAHHDEQLGEGEHYSVVNIIPNEHPLPGTWQEELGVEWEYIQGVHRNRLSNLTFAQYGNEYDNASFIEKRDMSGGFHDTGTILNRSLAQLDHWEEHAVNERSAELANIACEVWAFPQTVHPRDDKAHPLGGSKGTALDSEYLRGDMGIVYAELRRRILNLDSAVREEPRRSYIAFKTDSNFVDVIPQRSRLRLSLNMPFSEINDPQGICRDITNIERWGNGDVECGVSNIEQLDYALFLIRQSLDYRRDEQL